MCHKTRLGGGIEPQYFLVYLTPKKVKKTINSIWARTFNFRHISDIPHQTILLKITFLHFDLEIDLMTSKIILNYHNITGNGLYCRNEVLFAFAEN